MPCLQTALFSNIRPTSAGSRTGKVYPQVCGGTRILGIKFLTFQWLRYIV